MRMDNPRGRAPPASMRRFADTDLHLRGDRAAQDAGVRLRSALWRTLSAPFAVLAGAGRLGIAIGRPGLVLAAAAMAVLAWHYWRLRRLLTGLTERRHWVPARGHGAWNE